VDFTVFAADDGSSDSIGPATSSAPRRCAAGADGRHDAVDGSDFATCSNTVRHFVGAGVERSGSRSCRGCRRSSPPTTATTTAGLLFDTQPVGVDQQLSTSSSQGTTFLLNLLRRWIFKCVFIHSGIDRNIWLCCPLFLFKAFVLVIFSGENNDFDRCRVPEMTRRTEGGLDKCVALHESILLYISVCGCVYAVCKGYSAVLLCL